jgi:mono/diheme cytochrome c family protein
MVKAISTASPATFQLKHRRMRAEMARTLCVDSVIDTQISMAIRSVIMNSEGKSKARATQLGIAFSTLVCVMALSSTVRAADDNGWYTQDQATRGHQLFNNFCAQCHRPDLTGAAGPALVGDAFLKTWSNKPLGDLFSFEHSNMPATNPGSLPDDTVWTITAYILQKNGFPAGSMALSQPTGENRMLAPK